MIGIQDTSSNTFRQLLGNGLTYQIPKFQRDYSWDTEQWDDLWQDIMALINEEEPAHYLGYLVLQTSDNKNFRVIDGQQRLTTVSLLILSVIKALSDLVDNNAEPDQNQRRIESFRNSYIGYLDPVTLIASNKLKLNRNNDDFYRSKIVSLEELPKRGLNSSERLMKRCFLWFYAKVKAAFLTGAALAKFVDTLVDKLFFTVITVNDELNAFRVFETLNARGVQLSAADLLKNYLFSLVDQDQSHSSEIDELESMWAKIVGKLGNEKVAQFVRVYWNSTSKTVRKNDLFKAIRKTISSKKDVFDLVRALERNADVYIALRDPYDEFWKGKMEIQQSLRELKIFQVRQPFSVLMTAYNRLDEKDFKKLLKAVAALSFRYNIIGGLNPNEQEAAYNELALDIIESGALDLSLLEAIKPKDDSFETELINKEFKRSTRNHKIVKYILSKIERRKYNSDIDLFSDLYTVEHILPESPDDSWSHINDEVLVRSVYRLGNLTILERKLNHKLGSGAYSEKSAIYSKSSLGCTKAIPERYSEWNEETINLRQKALSKIAVEVWK